MKQTERLGVNAVERIFMKELGWIFREQTVADWGIDAQVEVANESRPTGFGSILGKTVCGHEAAVLRLQLAAPMR
jgi:hypothetical protein